MATTYTARPATAGLRKKKPQMSGYGGAGQMAGSWTGQPWQGRGKPSIGGAPSNPYQDVDINRMPWSQEMRNAIGDARYLPSYAEEYQRTSTPSAGVYGNAPGQARGYLGGMFGGQGGSPSEQPFMDYGMGLLQQGQGMLGQNGLPQAPNIRGAPTSYNVPNAPNALMTQQFNPNAVRGPQMQNVGAQQFGARDVFSNVNTGIPEWAQLAQMGQNRGPLAREQFGPERFGQDTLSQQAFQQAMGQAGGLGGAAIPDISNTYDEQFRAAALAGANKAGGRGFTDLGGTMAGRAMGQELGLAAERAAGERAGLQLQAAGLGQQGQQAAMQGLTNVGSASAGAAGDINKLNLESGLGYGGLGVTQRGQDYGFMGQGANKLSDVASLVNAVSGANLGAGSQNLQAQMANQGADITTGQANQDAALRAALANQAAGLEGYGLQTGRQQTQGDIWNVGQGMANQAGQINANTALGFGNLGLGYNELGAQNQNQLNQQLIDLYGTQGNLGLGQGQNQNQLLNTLLGGGAQYGQMGQTGDIQRQQNQIRIGELASAVMSGAADATAVDNEIQAAMLRGDQQYLNQLIQLKMQFAQESSLDRARNRAAIGGGAIGAFGNIAGALIPGGGGGG